MQHGQTVHMIIIYAIMDPADRSSRITFICIRVHIFVWVSSTVDKKNIVLWIC